MKKLLAGILSVSMLWGTAAVTFAEDVKTEEDIMLISEAPEETNEYILEKTTTEGTVKAVTENQIELEGFVLNIDDNTLVTDADLIPTEVKEGDMVYAVISTMTTRSIPPQAYAYNVIVLKDAEEVRPIHMTVGEVKDGFIYSADGNYEVSFENAEVAMYRTKNIVKAEELTKGSEIFVYADVMTMSIPALVNPEKIVVMSVAQVEETEEEKDEELSDVLEIAPDTQIIEGTVKNVTEDKIELNDFVLNVGEETLICNTELIPTEVKAGDFVQVVASSMTTRSLPPQAAAFYVIVKGEEEAAPIFVTVGKVEDGFIYSQDGSYKVSFENAEVSMYRTKNIVKAEELTKGSKIFVYADVMTMSIPALVNPSKIVVMNIATLSKAEELHEEGILLGTDNGLELEREVSRAEAVALIQRTTPSSKMVYTSDFTDVSEEHWAYANISWAAETKIVAGVGDGRFEPDRTVTGKELAKMLLNALGEEVEFDKAFEVALEKGLVTVEDGIEADDVLTREATANMIYNYLNR